MQPAAAENRPALASTRHARFHPAALAFWLPACLAAALLVAKAAVVAESYFAPLIFFPLLIGLVLGTTLVGVMRLAQLAHRPTVLAGAVLAGVLTILGQHYLSYRADLQRRQEKFDQHPGASLAFADQLPESFGGFLRRRAAAGRALFGQGLTVWLSWGLDAVLVLVAALAAVASALRLPYCEQCRSWYRVTRAGGLDVKRAEKLAVLAGCQPPPNRQLARFRLQNCTGGCGPTSLELFWQRAADRTTTQRAWIDAAQRGDLNRILDEPTSAEPSPEP